jgi:ribonuclease VapC
MIVDTSALVAVILGEPDAEAHLRAMATADDLSLSASTLVEALIVVEARQGPEASADLQALLADIEASVIPLSEEQANAAAEAWARFGKGRHPAGLNLGDTFSYALAKTTGEPLLFKGDDFTKTDIARA